MIKQGRLQTLILFVFITVSCVLFLFSAVFYKNLDRNKDTDDKQSNTLLLLTSVEDLSTEVLDIEQNIMDYSIEQNQAYQSQYQQSLKQYPVLLAKIQAAAFDGPVEKQKFNTLVQRMNEFAAIARRIFLQRNKEQISGLLAEEHLKANELARLTQTLKKEQRAKLHLQDTVAKQTLKQTHLLFVVFSVILFFFLIGAFVVIKKALKQKNKVRHKLEESVRSFSFMFYKSPVSKIITSLDTSTILMVNDAYLQVSGFLKEELIGKTVKEVENFINPDDKEGILSVIKKEGKVTQREIRAKTKSGKAIWLSASAEIILHNGEQCILVASIDITRQKEDALKLAESQAMFSSIFYKSPIAFSISKVKTAEIIDANDNFISFFGYSRHEVIGNTSTSMKLWYSEEDRRTALSRLRINDPHNMEIRMVHKSGAIKDIMANGDLIEINGEEYLISTFIEIGKRKNAERQLQALNSSLEQKIIERTKQITDYQYALDVSAIVAMFDADFNLKHVNDNYCMVSGWGREELIGRNMSDFKMKPLKLNSVEDIKAYVMQGNLWQGEMERMSKTGHTYWTYTTVVPFYNDSNEIYQYLSISFDISATKQVQEELVNTLHELENFSGQLNEAQTITHMGSWESNMVTGKDIWSDEFYRILGTEHGSITPSFGNFLAFVHPEDLYLAPTESFTKHKQRDKVEYYCRLLLKDGSVKYVFNEIRATYDADHNLVRLNGVLIDRTDERVAELEKAKITADLIRRNNSLEKFAHIVSHNLRAPLANISGLSSLLSTSNAISGESKKSLSHLMVSVDKLDEVVRDLNSILSISHAPQDEYEMVSLEEVVNLVCKEMKDRIDNEGVIVNVNFSEVNKVIVISSYLVYCLRNLLTNAIKFKKPEEQPVISISSYKTQGGVVISVKDNGLGMDLSIFGNKIFGLYNRYNVNETGKGMGLFMARNLIESMDGNISVESTPGEGSVFHVFLRSNGLEGSYKKGQKLYAL